MNPLVRIDALALAGVNAMIDELPEGARVVLLIESAPCQCHGARGLACAITRDLSCRDAAAVLLRAARELLGQCDHGDNL